MELYSKKADIVVEINKRIKECDKLADAAADNNLSNTQQANELLIRQYTSLLYFLDTIEVKDPYEQCIQYQTVKDGIEAHAEVYSFNIESELFNQLTKEQQALWRKEIEQAVISGGEAGVKLARDPRYKENFEVKETDLEREIDKELAEEWYGEYIDLEKFKRTAKHFYELGLKAQKRG